MILCHRPLRPEDAASIASLPQTPEELFHMFPAAAWPLTADQVLAAAGRRWDATVAEADGLLAGYANFAAFEAGSHCAIGNVVVAPAARRRGVARFLVGVMVDKAFAGRGVAEIRIAAHAANPAALLLYAGMGFAPYAVEAVDDWQGRRVPLIRLRLRRE